MDGRNLFESRAMKILGAKFASSPRPWVFISHSRLDKEKALAIARALEVSNVDYYFDENDKKLQLADEKNGDLKIVRCIDNGIRVCSYLLGIINENTKDSWCVPYEIGSASGRGWDCAHLIDREVNKLPSYIRAARALTDRADLRKWLTSELSGTAGATSTILELSSRLAAEVDYPDLIPTNRSLADLTFY